MEFVLDWKDLFYLLSIFVGLLVGFLLIIYGYKKNRDNILIGASFILLSYAIFLAFLIYSAYHTHLPHLYRTGNIGALSFAPLAYLYIRKVGSGISLKKTDLIHVIPVVIYIADFYPILFQMSSAEKTLLIQAEIQDPFIFVHFNQSRFFPSFFYTWSRTVFISFYWLFSARILLKASKKQKQLNLGKEWLSWMKLYIFCMMFLFLPYAVLSQIAKSEILFDLIHLTGALLLVLSGITVFFYPKVLYGLSEIPLPKDENTSLAIDKEDDILTPEKEKLIRHQLETHLFKEKKYLLKQYSIADLARDTSVPSYLLSRYINRNLDTNFSEFINKHRVDECCALMNQSEFQHLSLEGIADYCGFNNRNSFYTAFKRHTGKTPAQYLKSITNGNVDDGESN
jgi:AraC-like DNA-binding protein